MNNKAVKVSHKFVDSQCCVCTTHCLGQFTAIKESYVNIRGKKYGRSLIFHHQILIAGILVSYISILESTLSFQIPAEEDLQICESCKNTIIPFYLLKIKFEESCQPSEIPFEVNHSGEKFSHEEVQFPLIKQELDTLETESYKESEQETTKPAQKRRRRPERIQWKEKKEFASSEKALEFIKSQKIWSIKHTKPVSKNGEKRQYFRCNLVPKAQPRQCSSVMSLVTKSNGSTIMLQSVQPHDHSQISHKTK